MSKSPAGNRKKQPPPAEPAPVAPRPEFYRRRTDSRRAAVLCQLWKDGPISRGALADRMGLNLPMVSACVQELLKDNELIEEGYASSTGGRKAQLIDVNPRRGGVVAVEFSLHGILSAAADMKGRVSNHVIRPFETAAGTKAATAAIFDAVRHQIEFLRDDEGLDLLRIGVVLSGPVDEANGISVSMDGLRGWDSIPLGPMLSEEFEVPVILGNQVAATALAETISGQFRDLRTFLVVQLGPGLSCGLVLDGDVYRGQQPLVGELSAFAIPGAWKSGKIDGERALGSVASDHALVEEARRRIASGTRTDIPRHVDHGGDIRAEAIFRAADMGDQLAGEMIDAAAYQLGCSLASLVNLLGPQAVLFGGSMVEGGDRFLRRVQENVQRQMLPHLRDAMRFEPASFGMQAGVAGAVSVALLSHYNTFFD